MNKRIVSLLLLAIMFLSPFAFAESVGIITGQVTAEDVKTQIESVKTDRFNAILEGKETIADKLKEDLVTLEAFHQYIVKNGPTTDTVEQWVAKQESGVETPTTTDITTSATEDAEKERKARTTIPVPTDIPVEEVVGLFIPDKSTEKILNAITSKGEEYLIISGKEAAGETIEVMNLVTKKVGTIDLVAGNLKDIEPVFKNIDLVKKLANNPEAMAKAGYDNIKINGDIITATLKDGSSETIKDGIITGTKGIPGEASSAIGKAFNVIGGGGWDAVFAGVEWGAIAYTAVQTVGPIIGLSQRNTDALSVALSVSTSLYRAASVWDVTAGTWLASPWTLVGLSALFFVATYREEGTDVVEFECMPWQAPSGGDDCEVCNEGELPCSEYRCKSLGQNCEIVNAGTTEEKCVSVDRGDVGPPIISPNEAMLNEEYEYNNVKSSPPGPGFEIVFGGSEDKCLKAFTPLSFGVTTNEPAQCKIDFNHTGKFDEMRAFMGGNNLYLYNHSEEFSLPSVAILEESPVSLENGKDLMFFIRCKDQSGNENVAEYAVRFCVDPTPDSTAPKIEASSVMTGGCVAEGQNSAEVVFYTNEPADCKWSGYDQDYDSMSGSMRSLGLSRLNSLQVFGHEANLTSIGRENTEFYIRCKDQPGEEESDRNKMRESFKFSLRGSTGLKTRNLAPNGSIFGVVSPMPIELHVETLLGCDSGQAVCYYSKVYDDEGDGYIRFFETSTVDGIHNQRLDLTDGNHEYFVRCVDGGGNLIEDTIEFELDIDPNAPIIARMYEEADTLKIVTVRESDCAYSLDDCDFDFDEGTIMPYENSVVHLAEWDDKNTFYIKCRDEYRDAPVDCSAVVRPMRNFL